MFRYHFQLIIIILLVSSCTKDNYVNNFPANISFNISDRLLEGKHISSIATDNKGNIYIASEKELYFKNNSLQKVYTLDFPVMDLAIAPDETVWIGTNGGGLGHLSDDGFTWYTNANSGLPRDYVRNVEIGKDGKVWFSCCAFKIGGLGVFDGRKFEFLTPENSPLNQNVIDDVEIDYDGNIYIATSGTVGKSNIYRISGNTWECLGDEKGTFYWIWSFTISPSGIIYLIEDFSLSSTLNSNKLFDYKDNNWHQVETGDIPGTALFTPLKADKRNYCWLAGNGDHSPFLSVYNGEYWLNAPTDSFPDDYITVIEVDSENNILIGTWASGVFILNQ
jgi:ligand-binding sensor domain-containing protein